MSRALREKLKDGIVVFDIDGVLASYEFGEFCHYAEVWEEAFISLEDNPYAAARPLPLLQAYIGELGRENSYVCSVAEGFERECKADFVVKNYDIPEDNIIFVGSKEEKLHALMSLGERFPERQIAIVDDTVKTLDSIYENGRFLTVHITSFFDE